VVAKEGADLDRITNDIVTMPHYFDEYDTTVHFITAEEMARDHKGLPHGGSVLRSGLTADGHRHLIEYSLTLDSNPEFTASVLVAYARAVYRLQQEGKSGCVTVLDVPPSLLSPLSAETLRATLL
jgi:diaminopimelate dehydrogenase